MQLQKNPSKQKNPEITENSQKNKEHCVHREKKKTNDTDVKNKKINCLSSNGFIKEEEGRYNKCKNLIIINKTEAIDCKNLFEKEELNKKIKNQYSIK